MQEWSSWWSFHSLWRGSSPWRACEAATGVSPIYMGGTIYGVGSECWLAQGDPNIHNPPFGGPIEDLGYSIQNQKACPVSPIPELRDPDAISFENGNRWRPDRLTVEYQARLSCVQSAVTAAGGTVTTGSAWRSSAYQAHLQAILAKDGELSKRQGRSEVIGPECDEVRADVSSEMARHSLKRGQLVAAPGTSRHEHGMAFDVTPQGLSGQQVDDIAAQCSVSRRAVSGEPWHFQ